MNTQLQSLEPQVRVLAATSVSQSLSFCMERKYLTDISVSNNEAFELEAIPTTLESSASWIEIQQIGKPLDKSAEACFTAMQKILYSCFLPKEMQLLFLITGEGKQSHLYLGLRSPGKAVPPKKLVRNLERFIGGIWPGLQTEVLKSDDSRISDFCKRVASEDLENVYAFTGIPSMDSQYKTVYPATIDKLIAGMSGSKNYAYLVVADPIESNDAESMLYQLREMNGQAESLKSMNVTEGLTEGSSLSHTSSHSVTHTKSFSEAVSKKDFSKLGKAALAGTGLGIAASVFPAAGAVLEGCADAAGAISNAALNIVAGASVGNLISSLMPQKTTTKGTSDSESNSESDTTTTNESRSQSISRNLVNKHIEAVSEHLFYHSKRIESGKATGLWKVGVYLMAEKESDLMGGSLQLRSILSGQESIYEPVRIHDITDIMDMTVEGKKTLRELTLGHVSSPILMVNSTNGKLFNHPLGEHYKELKTVLTTKELSYLINFPLRSVPGISVVDSAPEFSLNQTITGEDDVIEFGSMLYGGSTTNMPYHLPISILAKHTLLSGINGTGKTNTVQAVLNSISQSKQHIPFLVIEPAKTEYVDWAIEYNKTHQDAPINIFIPGCKNYRDRKTRENVALSELHLNPFEPVWLSAEQDPNVLTHIDRLKSTFASAFPMYDILPVLMEDLIYSLYQSQSTNWIGKGAEPVYGKTLAPTLTSMASHVDAVMDAHGYEKRVSDNMKACLNTRISSLRRGWKKDMLDVLHSTPWEELFNKPCVINLSYVGDDVDKSFFMALVLQFLYEYRTAQAEIGNIDFNSNDCRHLTVIEEAHRVMQKCDKPELPQYKTAMMFSNMLSEIRAYGEGMFLVDQVPTRLIPDAIKNTNTKITHRLVAEDDCTAIAESMGISKEQKPIIPKLLVGQCLVSTALSTDKHWIKVNKVK